MADSELSLFDIISLLRAHNILIIQTDILKGWETDTSISNSENPYSNSRKSRIKEMGLRGQ